MSKVEQIKEILNTLRYYIQKDGGDLEFVSYKNKILTINVLGNCVGCHLIDNTYKTGVLSILKAEIPEIKDINVIEKEIIKRHK